MTHCMEKEGPTVSFLVQYEVLNVVNDDDFWNATVHSLIEAH